MVRAAGAFLALLLLVALVPALRRAVTLAASRVFLTVAAPLAPSIKSFDALDAPTQVLAVDGSVLGTLGSEARAPVTLTALPAHVKHAALAAEDQNFYRHGGIDPEAVARAVWRNVRGHSEGGSTITQQLAKINYAGSRRTLFRKAREALYALKLEQKYSKDELLERYLNQVYFGSGAYGIGEAAQRTFGVEPTQLTPAQAALLLGRIRGPSSRDPRTNPKLATARRNVVLKNMRQRGWLNETEYRDAVATPLALAPPTAGPGGRAPHFVEFVRREAAGIDELGGSAEARAHRVVAGGLRIETTLDPKVLDAATESVRSRLGAEGDPTTAVVTIAPGDGAIRALLGGLAPRSFDVASQGRRQPGSAFKPFVYLAALRARIDPRSVFDASSPRSLAYKGESYTVDNYEGAGQGAMTVDDALTHSVNTVFAQLVLAPAVGPGAVVRAATDAGIADDHLDRDRDRPSVALGGLSRGVTPLEMANAFATLAAGGTRAEPYAIARVRDHRGRELYTHKSKTTQAIDRREAGAVDAALMRVVQGGTATAAQVPGWQVGGKTGTTQNYGDAWFVGITSKLATAVWVGHPEGMVSMTNVHGRAVSGGSFPAMVFADTMRAALAGVQPSPLPTATIDGLQVIGTTSTIAPTTSTTMVTAVGVETGQPVEPPAPPPTAPPPPPPTAPPPTSRPTNTTTTTSPQQPTTTKPKGAKEG